MHALIIYIFSYFHKLLIANYISENLHDNKYFILIILLVLSSDKKVFKINLHMSLKINEILLMNSSLTILTEYVL